MYSTSAFCSLKSYETLRSLKGGTMSLLGGSPCFPSTFSRRFAKPNHLLEGARRVNARLVGLLKVKRSTLISGLWTLCSIYVCRQFRVMDGLMESPRTVTQWLSKSLLLITTTLLCRAYVQTLIDRGQFDKNVCAARIPETSPPLTTSVLAALSRRPSATPRLAAEIGHRSPRFSKAADAPLDYSGTQLLKPMFLRKPSITDFDDITTDCGVSSESLSGTEEEFLPRPPARGRHLAWSPDLIDFTSYGASEENLSDEESSDELEFLSDDSDSDRGYSVSVFNQTLPMTPRLLMAAATPRTLRVPMSFIGPPLNLASAGHTPCHRKPLSFPPIFPAKESSVSAVGLLTPSTVASTLHNSPGSSSSLRNWQTKLRPLVARNVSPAGSILNSACVSPLSILSPALSKFKERKQRELDAKNELQRQINKRDEVVLCYHFMSENPNVPPRMAWATVCFCAALTIERVAALGPAALVCSMYLFILASNLCELIHWIARQMMLHCGIRITSDCRWISSGVLAIILIIWDFVGARPPSQNEQDVGHLASLHLSFSGQLFRTILGSVLVPKQHADPDSFVARGVAWAPVMGAALLYFIVTGGCVLHSDLRNSSAKAEAIRQGILKSLTRSNRW